MFGLTIHQKREGYESETDQKLRLPVPRGNPTIRYGSQIRVLCRETKLRPCVLLSRAFRKVRPIGTADTATIQHCFLFVFPLPGKIALPRRNLDEAAGEHVVTGPDSQINHHVVFRGLPVLGGKCDQRIRCGVLYMQPVR